MSLYDQAVEMQLKLEAAQSADSGPRTRHQSRSSRRGARQRNRVSHRHLATAVTFVPRPSRRRSTVRPASAAVSAFRAGLSRYGPKAFQQQPATKLIEVARDQRVRAARWAGARWRGLFEGYQSLLEQTQPGQLLGGSNHRLAAERRATKLSMLQRQDPIADEDKVIADLCEGMQAHHGSSGSSCWVMNWLAHSSPSRTNARHSHQRYRRPSKWLHLMVDYLCAEVTTSLLDALRAAGVDDDLVVRRR